jgi:predicted alpha-1,6-mannanase (GH76 family)
MENAKAAAPQVVRGLQEWYGADPYSRKSGLYSYHDPSLDPQKGEPEVRKLEDEALTVSGLRNRMQDINRWWDSANAITAVIDYMSVTGDHSYLEPVVRNTFAKAPKTRRPIYPSRISSSWPYLRLTNDLYKGFINGFYDDEGWWALAWIAAYDLTGDESYLAAASDIFTDMTGGWDDFWGGGIYWGKYKGQPDRAGVSAVPHNWKGGYKNAIANELFITAAASLGVRHRAKNPSGNDHADYRQWAVRGWEWFSSPPPKGIAMINDANLINDSPDSQGVNNNSEGVWSYNQGVILTGLSELAELSGDETYLGWAEKIADAFTGNAWHVAQKPGESPRPHESGVINGILHEYNECNADGTPLPRPPSVDSTLFKGIYVRNLAQFYMKTRKPSYQQYILTNAESALAHMNDRHQFGSNWAAPVDVADFVRQTSGLDLVNAALLVS